MGASLRITVMPDGTWRAQYRRPVPSASNLPNYRLDLVVQPRAEVFTLSCRQGVAQKLEVRVVDIRPQQRHLVLLVAQPGEKHKFLCGHDERHWFVAGLPDSRPVRNVPDALKALKPDGVLAALQRERVPNKQANRRHNKGFCRQGEWFFVPRPDFVPEHPAWILRDEPIRRGLSKPHWVEELCRFGGETVYVCSRYPNGLTQPAYEQVLAQQAGARAWGWRVMRRNMRVFARGKVRHADHKTLVLPGWHEVLLSGEWLFDTMAFLD